MSASPNAQTFTEAWLPGPDNLPFYTRTYQATSPKAVLLFVHGFADHISRYEEVHARFATQDVTVFAYDLRGFGRTALDPDHRGADTWYGKTNRQWEIQDLEWWLQRLSKEYPGLPIFLMGHSAGGGLALVFATRPGPPPSAKAVSMLAGVIASSPLVHLSHETPTIVRLIARALRVFFPYKVIDAPMPEERFSRNPAVNQALRDDPWRTSKGSLLGLGDIIGQGKELLETNWANWPKTLPLLLLHGTEDEVNSCPAASAFFDKVQAEDKKRSIYQDALHDLMHEIDDIPDRVFQDYMSFIDAHIGH